MAKILLVCRRMVIPRPVPGGSPGAVRVEFRTTAGRPAGGPPAFTQFAWMPGYFIRARHGRVVDNYI